MTIEIDYAQLFAKTEMSLVVSDKNGLILHANQAAARLLGHRSVTELIGQQSASYYATPDLREELIARLIAQGTVGYFETTLRRQNEGNEVLIDVVGSSTVSYDEAGQPTRFEALFLDVTSYRAAQKALALSQQALIERDYLLQAVIDTPDILFVKDLEGRYQLLNQRAAMFIGVASPLLAHNKTAKELFSAELAQEVMAEDAQVFQNQEPLTIQRRVVMDDGEHYLNVVKYPYWDANGNLAGLVGSAHDITQLKQAEQELRGSFRVIEAAKQEWEATVDTLSSLVMLLDKQGRVLRSNLTLETWQLGAVKSIKGQHFHTAVHPNCMDSACPLAQKWAQNWVEVQQGQTKEWDTFDKPLGRFLRWQVRPLVELSAQKESYAIVVGTDITTERQMQARLEGIYQLGRELTLLHDPEKIIWRVLAWAQALVSFDHAGYGVLDWEQDALIYRYTLHDGEQQVHEVAYSLAGAVGVGVLVVKEKQTIHVPDIAQDERYTSCNEMLMQGSALCLPVIYQDEVFGVLDLARQAKNPFAAEDAQLIEALCTQMAIALENARLYTAQKKQMQALAESQKQLIWSEKLAALGRLTASIAHEINNPLQAIDGCLTLIQESLGETGSEARIERYVGIVESEISRVAQIVQRMRGIYRANQEERAQPVDVQAALQDVLDLTDKQLFHHDVLLETNWLAEPVYVLANEGNLKQVFLNLVINAGDAMKKQGGTLCITVVTDVGLIGIAQKKIPFVEIRFADTGPGIPEEVQNKLFEPFFTTKKEGSGLGLYVSYGIIETHKGEFFFESMADGGTTFFVRLPIIVA